MRERDADEVREYLEAENEYTAAVMRGTEELQEALYAEMLGRIREDDSSPPARDGDFWYYQRTEKDRAYPIYCRRRGGPDREEEVILDVNELAEGHEFFTLGDLEISPDHRRLAYSYDTAGREAFTLAVKDLESGDLLDDRAENLYYSLAWAADGRHLFYTTVDAAHRPYRVHRHALGGSGDLRVCRNEPDPDAGRAAASRGGRVLTHREAT